MKLIFLFLLLTLTACKDHPDQVQQARLKDVETDVFTVEHDGHLFVVYRGSQKGGIIHHPGCKCGK